MVWIGIIFWFRWLFGVEVFRGLRVASIACKALGLDLVVVEPCISCVGWVLAFSWFNLIFVLVLFHWQFCFYFWVNLIARMWVMGWILFFLRKCLLRILFFLDFHCVFCSLPFQVTEASHSGLFLAFCFVLLHH